MSAASAKTSPASGPSHVVLRAFSANGHELARGEEVDARDWGRLKLLEEGRMLAPIGSKAANEAQAAAAAPRPAPVPVERRPPDEIRKRRDHAAHDVAHFEGVVESTRRQAEQAVRELRAAEGAEAKACAEGRGIDAIAHRREIRRLMDAVLPFVKRALAKAEKDLAVARKELAQAERDVAAWRARPPREEPKVPTEAEELAAWIAEIEGGHPPEAA